MTRLRAALTACSDMFRTPAFRTETKPRPAHEIALDARRAERRAEDEARAAKRLYPTEGSTNGPARA